jgi:RNA polymerase subunit RPABC4/transcription elongation factor Spt4
MAIIDFAEDMLPPDAKKRICPKCGSTEFLMQSLVCEAGVVYDSEENGEMFFATKTIMEEDQTSPLCRKCRREDT